MPKDIREDIEAVTNVRSGTRSLSIMEELREAILNGDYEAGRRLNEVHISQALECVADACAGCVAGSRR